MNKFGSPPDALAHHRAEVFALSKGLDKRKLNFNCIRIPSIKLAGSGSPPSAPLDDDLAVLKDALHNMRAAVERVPAGCQPPPSAPSLHESFYEIVLDQESDYDRAKEVTPSVTAGISAIERREEAQSELSLLGQPPSLRDVLHTTALFIDSATPSERAELRARLLAIIKEKL
jgi:hypothetical protein